MEFENLSSVNASKRRRTPVAINASTAAFTLSAAITSSPKTLPHSSKPVEGEYARSSGFAGPVRDASLFARMLRLDEVQTIATDTVYEARRRPRGSRSTFGFRRFV